MTTQKLIEELKKLEKRLPIDDATTIMEARMTIEDLEAKFRSVQENLIEALKK